MAFSDTELKKFTRFGKSSLTENFSVFYLKFSPKPPRKLFGNSLLFPIKSFNFNNNFYKPKSNLK